MSKEPKPPALTPAPTIDAQSGVNAKGEPFVQIVCRGELIAQLDTAGARQFSGQVLEAAEAADTDAFLMSFFTKAVGTDDQRAAIMLIAFREWRESHGGRPAPDPETWIKPEGT